MGIIKKKGKKNVVAIPGEMIAEGGSALGVKMKEGLKKAAPYAVSLLGAAAMLKLGMDASAGAESFMEHVRRVIRTFDNMDLDTLKMSAAAITTVFGKPVTNMLLNAKQESKEI